MAGCGSSPINFNRWLFLTFNGDIGKIGAVFKSHGPPAALLAQISSAMCAFEKG